MSRGKHLNLEEARKLGHLDQFAKEHHATGDADAFERLAKRMAKGKPPRETESPKTPRHGGSGNKS